jgi:hypothetical protein
MTSPTPEVDRLLSDGLERLPLSQPALRPSAEVCRIRSQDPSVLFPEARDGQAALAGLLLRLGCWAESHELAQDIHSAQGSYWHGIIHRMEPDSSNAAYWFRRVGKHEIFPELFQRAQDVVKGGVPKHWCLKSSWDPFVFIEWCDEARRNGGPAETAASEIQMIEWQLLFDWCAGIDAQHS